MPVWWNWQTPGIQNPVSARTCGFDPRHRHQERNPAFAGFFCFFLLHSTFFEDLFPHNVRSFLPSRHLFPQKKCHENCHEKAGDLPGLFSASQCARHTSPFCPSRRLSSTKALPFRQYAHSSVQLPHQIIVFLFRNYDSLRRHKSTHRRLGQRFHVRPLAAKRRQVSNAFSFLEAYNLSLCFQRVIRQTACP